ncbi:mitochondrial import inner membrane translocase subunit tim-54 [Cordyceps fumosorosea ARSEF 2679]|uniref:Mitochondrial import inner membrane translocase subunit TIM54 n=1 Tax=Cordyceps fumosorosea (strain ARSEF 2679) TaxID=1081104 RepID=A0A167XEE7_CORFA|nr:mitochondrial import inner membrane translocase subunit tim-54 [Cordyceps fumosorosea ARSEF 2679]OAA64874.1 mitochondrial import inner membrane translocase subunit tim-54 [Cordyceps fumosorosea ARSEF 2679]
MADQGTKPPAAVPVAAAAAPSPAVPLKPEGNPALRMMGLPNLPKRLPSRNWLIFWALCGTISGAIIYDRREKTRATERWRRAVAPLATEPIGAANQLPRRLTVYIAAPPGDGLRAAQDHFIEYAKPVLAAAGVDWEFVQGRQQGDVRAAVAERVRRARRAVERPGETLPATGESVVEDLRTRLELPRYLGVHGDVVFGRHAWKEYVRGLHEGWLGPLDPPPAPVVEAPEPAAAANTTTTTTPAADTGVGGDAAAKPEEDNKKKDEKPKRPPQPVPYNKPEDYEAATLPSTIPDQLQPSTAIPFPHRLGFRHTFVRLGWFLNRRALADDIGREVAAVCFAASRDYAPRDADGAAEQQRLLDHEERNWQKSVWAPDVPPKPEDDTRTPEEKARPPKERIWASPLLLDERVAQRMRRFEIEPEREAAARAIVVPEEAVEGFIKGSLRGLWRWGVRSWTDQPMRPNVGNVDDE